MATLIATTVSGSGNDWEVDAAGGFLSGQDWFTIGNAYGSIFSGGCHFTCNIPAGATIIAAFLVFHSYSALTGSIETIIYCEDASNPAACTTQADHFGRARTTGTTWDFNDNWALNDWRFSPDFASDLQEVVDNNGGTGGSINVFIDDDGTTSPAWRQIIAVDSAAPVQTDLYVVYSTGAEEYPIYASHWSYARSSGTDHDVQLPPGVLEDETVICLFCCDDDQVITWPANWNEIYQEDAGGNGPTLGIAWYKVQAGDKEGDVHRVTLDGSEGAVYFVIRMTNAADPAVDAPEASAEATGTSTAPNPAALSPTGGSKKYAWIVVEGNDDADIASGYPTNFNDWQHSITDFGSSCNIAQAARIFEGATLDPDAFTIPSEEWEAAVVAVYPALEVVKGAETGSGVDAKATGNPIATLTKSETGSGAEGLLDRDLVLISESGTGLDTILALLGKKTGDTGTCSLENSYLHILESVKSSSDSGSGADISSLEALLQRDETGVGVEAVVARALYAKEYPTGAIDLAKVITAVITGTGETGSGVEASLMAYYQKVTETGEGVDSSTLEILFKGEDSGAGAEAITLLAAMIAHDTGVGLDNVLTYLRNLVDSGQGSEVAELVGFIGRRMRMIVYQQEAFNLKVYTSETGK